MIREGTAGTNDGDGLAQTINRKHPSLESNLRDDADFRKEATNQYGVTGSRAFYIAARLYNSGSVASNGDLGGGIATHCYSSDIANRLTGWVQAQHSCYLDG
jgi:hypothetical protein